MLYFILAICLIFILYLFFANDSKKDQRRDQLLKQENENKSLQDFNEKIKTKFDQLSKWTELIETNYLTDNPPQIDFHFNGLPFDFDDYHYTAFDFETANDDIESVLKLSIVHFRGNKLIEIKEYLFNPGEQFTLPENIFKYTKVHGIRPSDVIGNPTFLDKWCEIQPELSGRHLIAHNIDFDINILRNIIALSGHKLSKCKFTCTHYYSKLSIKWMYTFRLKDVCKDANLPIWDNPSKFKAVSTGLLYMYLSTIVSRTSYNRFMTGVNINLKKIN